MQLCWDTILVCKTQVMVTAEGAYGRGQYVRDCIELRSRQWKMYNKEAIELWVAVEMTR